MPFKYESMQARIQANIKVNKKGCWVWQGKVSKDGYGKLNVRKAGKVVTLWAHHVTLAEWKGIRTVPDGKERSHLCHNATCCNPKHLVIESHAKNVARKTTSKRV